MTSWLVHGLRDLGFDVVCLGARDARAALKTQINKTDQNDAEGLAQIVRTGWYRSVHVKSFDRPPCRYNSWRKDAIGGQDNRLSRHIRGGAQVVRSCGLAQCEDCHSIGKSRPCLKVDSTLR